MATEKLDTSFAGRMERASKRIGEEKQEALGKFIKQNDGFFLHTMKMLMDWGDTEFDEATFAFLTRPRLTAEQEKILKSSATALGVSYSFSSKWKGRGIFYISTVKQPALPHQFDEIDWAKEDEEEKEGD